MTPPPFVAPRRRTCLALATVLLVSAWTAQAHEIGTTRVTLALERSRTYRVEITTDAQALLDKLRRIDGLGPVNPTADDLGGELDKRGHSIVTRAVLAADQRPLAAAAHWRVTPPTSPGAAWSATIVLEGTVPAGVRTLSWSYGWTFAKYALVVHRSDGSSSTEWLEGDQPSAPLLLEHPASAPSRAGIAWQYLILGITHIVPGGIDHVLFVLGLYLLGHRPRLVLAQVTTFTVAHSITLGLGMFGLVSVPPRIVEPLIAVSIAYVAIENLFATGLKWRRLALVFAFGLLHGLGFASALGELGLPRQEFVTALVTFNLGVEIGQLSVIAAAFVLVGSWCGDKTWYRRRIVVPASLAIALIALVWTVQRTLG